MKNYKNSKKSTYKMTVIGKKLTNKSLWFIAIFGLMISFSACQKFLEKEPTFVVKENYYNNETDVNIGLAGVYDVLGREELYGGTYQVEMSTSDEGFYSRSTYTPGSGIYLLDAADPNIAKAWKYLYEGIERANVFLSRIDGVNMPQTAKDAAKGEVKFLRAYYYFVLANDWGDVPLKITPTASVNDINIKRTPQKEVYDFIVKEMIEAEGLVKTATAIGYGGKVSKSTVRGILARVYLKMAGAPLNGGREMYVEALKWARKIVFPDSGPVEHRLQPSYQKIFTNYAGDRYDIGESIWEIEFYGNRSGDFEAGRIGNSLGLQCNDETKGYSYGFVNATKKLYDAYEANDVRRDWSIAPFAYTYTTVNNVSKVSDSTYWTPTQMYQRNCGKFRRGYENLTPKNKNYTPENFPLLRYADVLLMLAEAENEVNGPTTTAKQAIKDVRLRANASDITATLSSYEDVKNAVRKERFLELAFEGLRKFDLIRWDIFVSEMNNVGAVIKAEAGTTWDFGSRAGLNVTNRNKLWPIPILELSLNKAMVQNTGW